MANRLKPKIFAWQSPDFSIPGRTIVLEPYGVAEMPRCVSERRPQLMHGSLHAQLSEYLGSCKDKTLKIWACNGAALGEEGFDEGLRLYGNHAWIGRPGKDGPVSLAASFAALATKDDLKSDLKSERFEREISQERLFDRLKWFGHRRSREELVADCTRQWNEDHPEDPM
eukprot:TRINITY_DN52126_c0_g1_i1.p1 TRINITY_DN52126_c0_g1~~TRINITY_DN52126_c0_g1_i1.p1  ORF type:complete len:170 (-),score=12.93 TRINITY_DN52126_c0_g1_i1:184-693(-)